MTEEGIEEYSPAMMIMSSSSSDPFKKMKKDKNYQRRFSDEQIKSLEKMFELETRLEPKKKVQLARELGLQPRQVAIWFQNKRARWKSKQLETEFNLLRQNYNDLADKFECLKKENQTLVSELQRLNKKEIKKTEEEEERQCCGDDQQAFVALSSTDHESENEENQPRREEPEMEIYEKSHHHHHHDNDDYDYDDNNNNNIKREYFGGFEEEEEEEHHHHHHIMNIVEPADSCLTSSDDWRGFKSDSTTLLDQSSTNYPWWDFWS